MGQGQQLGSLYGAQINVNKPFNMGQGNYVAQINNNKTLNIRVSS